VPTSGRADLAARPSASPTDNVPIEGDGVKIAVIGGGSTYTPELVSGLSRERERIDVHELVLHDIDAERREVVGGLAARMLERQGYDGELLVTDDLDRAVDGADFVLIQIRVGGQEARLSDETVPLMCGCIGQETTGAGGLAKALRTVPVVLEIAERVRDRAASDAWIVDFTNPVGIVTRALLDAGHRAIGLCNVAIGVQRRVAQLRGIEPGRVEIDQVGLNHLSWVRFVRVDGTDVLPELIATHGDELAGDAGVPLRLVEELGVLPSYYLHYFYAHDRVLAEQLDGVPRAAAVAEIERELLQMYRDPGLTEKPALLERRGGAFYSECAIGLVGSIASDDGGIHVVDVRNGSTVRGLADDDVVEVPARVGRNGAVPLPQPLVAPELLGLIQHVTAYERLAVDAAISGDSVTARKALLTHPLIAQHAPAEELIDRLLEAGAAHLPQFEAARESIA
jgi:6-phospho-beta-glucosidase